jgi:hypothetical protein
MDFFEDKATFPDDLEIPIGNQKIKMGDLRAMTAKQQTQLAEKLQAAERDRQEAAKMSVQATEIFNNLKRQQDESQAASEKVRPSEDGDDFETNNWWTPVRKRMTAQEEKIAKALDKLDKLNGSFEKAALMFATDRWNSQYDRVAPKLKKVKQYEDWDVDKVRDYATKNQLVDQFGFPSIERAVQELTKATDLEEARKQAREEGFKEGQMRARLAGQGRPTSAGGKKAGVSAVSEKGLEGLGDDMADDPELMDLLENARQAFDPQVQ